MFPCAHKISLITQAAPGGGGKLEDDFEKALKSGESAMVEFKRCGGNPETDTFETICSFANHTGGHLYLGVEDDGTVRGVSAAACKNIERNIANVTANPKLFSPAILVETEHFVYRDKTFIHIWVPMNSSVVRYKNVVYDRVADADVRIASEMQISQMYLRKQQIFTEQRILPTLGLDDLNRELFDRVRIMANNAKSGHSWMTMDDETLLRSARLYVQEYETGREGLTLAAVLLLGKDEVIANVLPAYKTDVIVRRKNLDRYDDRRIVKTNLIDSFYVLSDFLKKNMKDPFHLEPAQAVSPRDVIIRELVVNTLIHREYTSPIPAQIVVSDDCIETKNGSRSMFEGALSLREFTPIPKNPTIADFFLQIGLAEELGSGVRNLTKYADICSGRRPSFSDGLVFSASVPVGGAGNETEEEKEAAGAGSVSDIAEAVEGQFAERGYATVSETLRQTGAPRRTVSRFFADQLQRGDMIAQGKTRGRKYYPAAS